MTHGCRVATLLGALMGLALPSSVLAQGAPPDSAQSRKIVALVEKAAALGAGWVDYLFPKPGRIAPSHKWTYVKAVTIDGAPGLIGAGFYVD